MTPSSWTTTTIYYTYRGPAFDFGTENVRKWVPRIVVNADNVTNLSLQVSSNNDNSGSFQALAEIRSVGSSLWGDPDGVWGDDNQRWNYNVVISHWRRFPAGYIRCSYKQVVMTNSYTLIDSKSSTGTASTNAGTRQITLDDGTKSWPLTVVDYYISFSNDNYSKEFKILTRNSNTVITVEDVTGNLTTTPTRTWKIRGYKRSENLNLISYILDYALITQTQTSARVQGGS